MNEIFLMKLGEIVLKGGNKRQFESRLRQNVRRRMKHYGNFDVYIMQSTVYVEPQDEMADLEGAWEACHSIFGVVSLCRCRPCEKNLDAIFDACEAYLIPLGKSHQNDPHCPHSPCYLQLLPLGHLTQSRGWKPTPLPHASL